MNYNNYYDIPDYSSSIFDLTIDSKTNAYLSALLTINILTEPNHSWDFRGLKWRGDIIKDEASDILQAKGYGTGYLNGGVVLSENSYMFREIITLLDCLKCGSSKNLNIYITHAKQKDVICNKCNTEMKINSDRKISNFENKTFAELSIPNLELLTSDEKYIIINNEKSRK